MLAVAPRVACAAVAYIHAGKSCAWHAPRTHRALPMTACWLRIALTQSNTRLLTAAAVYVTFYFAIPRAVAQLAWLCPRLLRFSLRKCFCFRLLCRFKAGLRGSDPIGILFYGVNILEKSGTFSVGDRLDQCRHATIARFPSLHNRCCCVRPLTLS